MDTYNFVRYQYDWAAAGGNRSGAAQFFRANFGNPYDLDIYKRAPTHDWQDEVMGETPLNYSTNITVGGGTDRLRFNISLTQSEDKGIILGSGVRRTNLNMKFSAAISDRLTLNFNPKFSYRRDTGAGGNNIGSGGLIDVLRYRPTNGLHEFAFWDPKTVDPDDEKVFEYTNPKNDIKENTRKKHSYSITNQAGLEWKPAKGLALRSEGAISLSFSDDNRFYGAMTGMGQAHNKLPVASITDTRSERFLWTNTASYGFDIAGAHNFSFLLGQEIQSSQTRTSSMTNRYFPRYISADKAISNMNLGTPYQATTSLSTADRTASFFGQANYNYEHRYLLSLTMRADGSTKFAADISGGVERVSKEFCWAMIARMALSCGGYSLRPDMSAPGSYGTMKRPDNYLDYYRIARDYCDSVIVSGRHSLSLPYHQVFINECNYMVINQDDPIFEIPFAKNSSGHIGYIQGPTSQTYEGNTSGKNIWGGSNGGARLNALYRFFFDEDDLRRDYVNGMWYYKYDGETVLLNDRTVFNNKWSKLWSVSSMGTNSGANTGINYPYMRYADVLLMYAEAVCEIDGGVSGADGAKAVDALRQVRRRAFRDGSKVEAYLSEVSASKEAFLKAVLDERKFEFAGENMRWKDLVRNNMYSEELYWTFLRYYGVAENGAGSSDYLEAVALHDGMDPEFWERIPYDIFYKASQPNPADVSVYPNTSLDIVTFYDLYHSQVHPGGDWKQASLFGWWNDGVGCPEDRMLYSFFGYIRADQNGVISVVRDGALETPSLDNLPPVRYILPYPRTAIQRSGGVYKNYYGYN